ncbi:MAG: sugar phosphate isomerase/epimerase [Acidobacteria bacterium]|nr:sugar phosphate isomerase/epimerase [Acidobacteriota bacterium]MBI3424488.1 sugar phosphate isomerase/epimerase [Acidobacteriota bacterium]
MTARRDFLKLASSAAVSSAILTDRTTQAAVTETGFKGQVILFSKHLPQLDCAQLAHAVKTLGFAGVDLTVRPGGHVLPERVTEDLPKAVATIRAAELSVPMITTGLVSASEPTAKPILSAAGKAGIPFLKPGYWKYQFSDVRQELAKFAAEFRGLVELAKQNGVQLGFHNHEGNLGGPLLDVVNTIDTLDAKSAGYYFDVRHAVVEGGGAGWKIAFNLIAPRLKMIAVKDFYWEKTAKGWKIINCPLGAGMVDWQAYFKLLQQANFAGPISLHLEYEIGGATKAAVEENTLAAAQRDLAFVQARLKEAYLS